MRLCAFSCIEPVDLWFCGNGCIPQFALYVFAIYDYISAFCAFGGGIIVALTACDVREHLFEDMSSVVASAVAVGLVFVFKFSNGANVDYFARVSLDDFGLFFGEIYAYTPNASVTCRLRFGYCDEWEHRVRVFNNCRFYDFVVAERDCISVGVFDFRKSGEYHFFDFGVVFSHFVYLSFPFYS